MVANEPSRKTIWIHLGILALIGAVTRYVISRGTHAILWPDSLAYIDSARAIASSLNFEKHEIFRTPGYPSFLALFFWIFGATRHAGVVIIIVQQILGIISSLLWYNIARRILVPRWAFLVGALFLLNPVQMYYEVVVQTELLFVFLLTLSIFSFCKLLETGAFRSTSRESLFKIVGFGILLGFLVLTRPIGQWLILAFPVSAFAFEHSIRKVWKPSVVMLIASFITLLPWMQINKNSYGFFGLSKDLGINLFHKAFDVDGLTPPEDTKYRAISGLLSKLRQRPEVTYMSMHHILLRQTRSGVESDKIMLNFALESYALHPMTFITGTLKTLGGVFASPRDSAKFCSTEQEIELQQLCSPASNTIFTKEFPNRTGRISPTASKLIYSYFKTAKELAPIVCTLALFGLAFSLTSSRWKEPLFLLLIIVLFYFTGITSLLNREEDRFRLPADPSIAILAAYCLAKARELLTNPKRS